VTTYLLDTNTWVAHIPKQSATVTGKLRSTDPAEIRLCSVVLAELLYGVYRSPPAYQGHNLSLVIDLQRQFASVPFDDGAAEEYAKLKADLAAKGTPIGPNDLLIAAIALANGMTLVTHNTAEFSRAVGLPLDDWQV
jgi:tRNA(fMet)-specific endonuclease VapC